VVTIECPDCHAGAVHATREEALEWGVEHFIHDCPGEPFLTVF